jgi:hypothetical protein
MDSPELKFLKIMADNQRRVLSALNAQLADLDGSVQALLHIETQRISKEQKISLKAAVPQVGDLVRNTQIDSRKSAIALHRRFAKE